MSAFSALYSHSTLATGLSDIYSQFDDVQLELTKNVKDINERLDNLGEEFVLVDSDLSNLNNNLPGVFNQVRSLFTRVGALEQGSSSSHLSTSGSLSTASLILDEVSGLPLASVGQMFQKLASLEAENAAMKLEIGARGGVAVGTFAFSSMSALDALVSAELPILGLSLFDLFVDIGSLHCHNPNVEPGNTASSISWDKATKAMGIKGYGESPRKVLRSYHEPVCSLYTDGKDAVPGTTIAAFKTAGQWLGEGGRDG